MSVKARKMLNPRKRWYNYSAHYIGLWIMLFGFYIALTNGEKLIADAGVCSPPLQRSKNIYVSNYLEHPGCDCETKSSKTTARTYVENQICGNRRDINLDGMYEVIRSAPNSYNY